MKKWLAIISVISLLLVSACGPSNATDSGGLPEEDWETITSKAEGTKVNLFMWGGDDGINRYIDDVVAPMLKEKNNIELNRVPLDTQEILQKLQTEKRAGKDKGTIDIVWINGENFKNAKENDLLAGPFTDKLPNFTKYYDTESHAFQYDFGTETEGYEAPWGKVQFVFFYNSEKVKNPPSSYDELKAFMKEHPGKFTYPNPADFTGNAFLRHLLYAKSDSDLAQSSFNEGTAEKMGEEVWKELNEMKPFLWREGETYPATLTDLDKLYSQEEVWMTMGYNEARAEHLIKDGVFPENTKSFILNDVGSIGNTHFLAIPFNSPNKEGALVTINELLSPEAQYEKVKPDYWGESSPISYEKLDGKWRDKFMSVDRGGSVLEASVLEETYRGELDANYVEWLKENWIREVAESQ
ncbi:ABC transporter substrate-binding protein [Rossellomorea yichunensis]|jgi:putative spermidine/putrescine transport system substrate-binding protein|uniref:ABC transporter substrate-binding protein n=1 Tax=Rossellomorea yichunensis TaxID=3077331 RepID=UPI0028DD82A8|nr:ABC transporter substrate-binding protein [Rossellomorea sp. YC4-1]MDT9027562.1 ABC transporter substrate-binding protein [Rossellomorea sp. YC4-1]